MEIKDCFMKNLTALRKSAGLTQAELADKLNYSDKAVSKWERGESLPDIYVLKQIADCFGLTVDALISPMENVSAVPIKKLVGRKRLVVSLFSSAIVWLVAICAFSFIGIIIPTIKNTWLSFIYAPMINFLILYIFCCIWKSNFWKTFTLSAFIWMVILSVYLTLKALFPMITSNLWMLFLIGIPAQFLIVILAGYIKININSKKLK